MIKHYIYYFTLSLFVVFFSMNVQANSNFKPSASQMELFKQLPIEQQQALAKKYGLTDLDLGRQIPGMEESETDPQPLIMPREVDTAGLLEQQGEVNDDSLPYYGYDIFAGQPTTFAPVSMSPVPSNYAVGPGDSFVVTLFGKENNEYSVTVSRDGMLAIPNLKPFSVVGLTYQQMRKLILAKVQQHFIGVEAAVSFGELRGIQIMVVGEAFTPGTYTLSSLSTITQALFSAGGIKQTGSLRNIQLKRSGKLIQALDLYDLLLKGDSSNDQLLQAGDVIFIPAAGKRVEVDGEVGRPAIYEIKSTESYQDLLDIAGGATSTANLTYVTVNSAFRGHKRVISLDMTKPQQAKGKLGTAYTMRVARTTEQTQDAVQVYGESLKRGLHQWHNKLTIKSFIGDSTSFFTDNTDLNYALVLRKMPDFSYSVRQFSPKALLTDTSDDFALQASDKVFFFSIETNSDVMVSGAVLDSTSDIQRLVKEKKQNTIERAFANDLYRRITENPDLENKAKAKQSAWEFEELVDEPRFVTLNELQSVSLEQLLVDKKIDDNQPNSRNYLLWMVYKLLIDNLAIDQAFPFVQILGDVNYPGTYPKGMATTVKDLLQASGGSHRELADIVKISRLQDGRMISLNVRVDQADKFELQAKDRITVFKAPTLSDSFPVRLSGEVIYPGVYQVNRGDTIRDVISLAGGLRENAYFKGAIFTRESVKMKQQEDIFRMTTALKKQIFAKELKPADQMGAVNNSSSLAETEKLLKGLLNTRAIGRIVVSLEQALSGDETNNFELQPKDELFIPSVPSTVSVIGEVYQPTAHKYRQGLSYKDYLSQSGGATKLAEQSELYVIKADGSVARPSSEYWFNANQPLVIEVGDTIVVPIDGAPINKLNLWSSVSQIVYQSAIGIAAINNLSGSN